MGALFFLNYTVMKNIFFIVLLEFVVLSTISAQQIAFPGAEGYGKYTSGGRGGRVIKVTNLNDSGEGSLRDAIEQKGPRIIVFAVDGTIDLQSRLVVQNDSLTIAGQSAPGDGICLKGYPFYVNANNFIIRYIRCRMGDLHKVEDDAMGGRKVKNLIVDHCSSSWSVDECMSFYGVENLTVQWCMITHSLSKSFHFKGAHGFGGIWGGEKATFHHNLLAHHSSRNPRFASDGCTPTDFRNNVVYNWGYKAAYGGGRGGKINFVGNYYKPGPATSENKRTCFLDAAVDGTGCYYLHGNVMVGSDKVTKDNWLGAQENITPSVRADKPFPFMPINEDTPIKAYKKVLRMAGCNLHRDSYDARIIREVRTGKATEGETFAGGGKGIIDSQSAVGGWPVLEKGKAPVDTDGDGIPDVWEKKRGLNPKDGKDGSFYTVSSEFTNVEVYLNDLVR